MVVWITGISGAGKTTLCAALCTLLKPRLAELVVVDGDTVREIFGNDLGHSEPERVRQIRRIQALARELDRQGLVVLVAAVYARVDLLQWNRATFSDYFEVHLDAPLTLVQSRDAKGLYAKAARGEMPDVVGLDVPWHPPVGCDLRLDASRGAPPIELAREVARRVPRLAAALPRAAAGVAS